MLITKQHALDLIEKLPETVDIEEIMYRLYLEQKIREGEDDVKNGRVTSHDEVMRETAEWFTQ